MSDFGQIRIIPGRIITSANNTIVFDEGGADLLATIPAGTYWGGYNATLDGLGYSDIYSAIETAMTSAGANTYSITAGTPTESTSQTGRGLNILSQAGGAAWTLKPTSGSWTFPLDLLGLVDNSAHALADISSTDIGTFEFVTTPFTRGGEWFSWTLFSDNGIDDPGAYRKFREFSSDQDATLAYAFSWLDAEGTADFRTLEINEIPAAHILGDRALIAAFASSAQLAQGDTTNGFIEQVWEYARVLRGRGVNASDMIIAYDDDWPADGADITISAGYDIARMASGAQREDSRAVREQISKRLQRFRLKLELAVKTKGYDH